MKKLITILALITANAFAVDVTIDKVVVGWQTEAERQAYTGLAGEVVRNTTMHSLTTYDGSKLGGYPNEPRIAHLVPTGTDAQNAVELQALYTALLSSNPSMVNQFIIRLGPGTYNFGAASFDMTSNYISIQGAISRPVTRILPFGCELTGWVPPVEINNVEINISGNGFVLSDIYFGDNAYLYTPGDKSGPLNIYRDLLCGETAYILDTDSEEVASTLVRIGMEGTLGESLAVGFSGYAFACYGHANLFTQGDGYGGSTSATVVHCSGGANSFEAGTTPLPTNFKAYNCSAGTGSFRPSGMSIYHCKVTGAVANWGDSAYYCIGPAASVDASDIADRHCIAE